MNIDINPGEIKIDAAGVAGRVTFATAGLEDMGLEGGNLRLVIALGSMEQQHFFKVPTVELAYHEHVDKSDWVAEFNGTPILEKIDHAGNKTLLLLQRDKLEALQQRHENVLVIHGDLPAAVKLKAADSFFNLLA